MMSGSFPMGLSSSPTASEVAVLEPDVIRLSSFMDVQIEYEGNDAEVLSSNHPIRWEFI
jgi:hypothetical protein